MATAASLTLCLGSGTVAVVAIGGRSPLRSIKSGSGTASGPPSVVTQYRDVYDQIVVAEADGSTTDHSQARQTSSAGAADQPAGGDSGDETESSRDTKLPAPKSSRGSTGTSSPKTTSTLPGAAPSTTPTTQPLTTTTRPAGVPHDWPAGTPIPPMPEGCQKPQLEDDGEWNCDH